VKPLEVGECPPRTHIARVGEDNGVDFMRHSQFAGLFVVGLVAIASPSSARTQVRAPAVAADQIQDRYCVQGRTWGYPGNCEFSTYEQCMATASGTDAYCGENPQYLFAEQQRNHWPR
jgi:hypothetical protein